MSHEIRTPCSAVVGALAVLRETPALSDHVLSFLDIISAGASQILQLVEDALAVGFDGDARFHVRPKPVSPLCAMGRRSRNARLLLCSF